MKKILKILIVVTALNFMATAGFSQVTISPSGSIGAKNLPELIAVNLYNSSANDVEGAIEFKIYSGSNLVISGVTKGITLKSQNNLNINLITAEQSLLPIQLSFVDENHRRSINNGYQMLEGSYRVCLRFIKGRGSLSDEFCESKQVGYLGLLNNQLRLINPPDASETPTTNPLFSWINIGRGVTYSIKIVEVNERQSAESAMKSNVAFHQKSSLTNTNYLYPLSAQVFEECKTYAWQVTAYEKGKLNTETKRNFEKVKSISEVFSFKTSCYPYTPSSSQRQRLSASYITLHKAPSNYVHLFANNTISFKYIEKYNSADAHIRITDLDGDIDFEIPNHVLDPFDQGQTTGVFYINIETDLLTNFPDTEDPNIEIENDDVLLLEVTNKKGEIWQAKFKFQ